MASGRMLSKNFFRDPKLTALTYGHRIIYAGAFTHADDYGRYVGDPLIWKSDLAARDPYLTEEILLAIQHDLAQAGMLGFYTSHAEQWCVIYKFYRHQRLQANHLHDPEGPPPPKEMWHLCLHPQDCGKKWDIPDIPYATYKEVVGNTKDEPKIWLPASQRPDINFITNEQFPFGTFVRGSTPKKPITSHANVNPDKLLFEAPQSELNPIPVIVEATTKEREILNTLHQIPKWPKRYPEDLQFIRETAVKYPRVDILRLAQQFQVGKIDSPLTAKSRPHSQFDNWARIQQERYEGKSSKTGETRVGGVAKL